MDIFGDLHVFTHVFVIRTNVSRSVVQADEPPWQVSYLTNVATMAVSHCGTCFSMSEKDRGHSRRREYQFQWHWYGSAWSLRIELVIAESPLIQSVSVRNGAIEPS